MIDKYFYDRAGAFELDGCSFGKENCACTNLSRER